MSYKTYLNEEIFRRPETDEIDKQFKSVITYLKSIKSTKELKDRDLNILFQKQINIIQKLILKLFNANVSIVFDDTSNPTRLNYGMCIYPSITELQYKLEDAIENNKTGFYLKDCRNVVIFIDLALLTLCRINNLSERHLTAVLLHELGHKIYVNSQRKILRGQKSRFVAINLFGIRVFIPISYILPVIGLILINRKNIGAYVDSEHLSDTIAVKYGYSKEIYNVLDLFYKMTKKNTFSKKLTKFLNQNNASKLRRDKLITALEKELADSKNSAKEKEILTSIIKELRKSQELSESQYFYKINSLYNDRVDYESSKSIEEYAQDRFSSKHECFSFEEELYQTVHLITKEKILGAIEVIKNPSKFSLITNALRFLIITYPCLMAVSYILKKTKDSLFETERDRYLLLYNTFKENEFEIQELLKKLYIDGNIGNYEIYTVYQDIWEGKYINFVISKFESYKKRIELEDEYDDEIEARSYNKYL